MNIGMARAIFENLENCGQPIEVKGMAIRKVIDMETHNSVTKDQMLKAMDWMWNQIFELKQEGEADIPDKDVRGCSEIPNSSDTISRQAAIDALGEGAMVNYQAAGNDNGLIKAINVIKGLPSAEPQIIRCKECKHWTNNISDSKLRDNYCNEAVHGFYYRCSGDDYCSFAERRTDE